ncbi:hypothetical protein JW921_07355, partial [Candidatus Fermentibacterales bacterium]|nr:hypothetical protein [Candidatus Fermentibacterales bacterium]
MIRTGSTGPLRLGALISGGGRTVLNLLERIRAGSLDAEVCLTIASRECAGVDLLRAEGVDVSVVPYKQMPDVRTY